LTRSYNPKKMQDYYTILVIAIELSQPIVSTRILCDILPPKEHRSQRQKGPRWDQRSNMPWNPAPQRWLRPFSNIHNWQRITFVLELFLSWARDETLPLPSSIGNTPPYKPRTTPSSRRIVQYARPIVSYLRIWGAACCLVFTVSTECIIKSPDEPPIAPAIAALTLGKKHLETGEIHGQLEGNWSATHLVASSQYEKELLQLAFR